ncbi:MAG: hypothetical protein WBA77_03165 [Microcoleaceae cyanobacterium]
MSPSSNYPSQTSSSAASEPTPPSENPAQVPQDVSNELNAAEETTVAEVTPTKAESSKTTETTASESVESNSEMIAKTDTSVQPDEPDTRMLQHPIPPPSEPRQYRAIGLVRGRYQASEEQFTQGTLYASDGSEIDAVLLGRVMSLVKKHIDLTEEHLWVVYPRTRQEEENLHVQIVGVWEPETLKSSSDEDEDKTDAETVPGDETNPPSAPASSDLALAEIKHGYFSIRGEVVFQSQDEDKYVIIKIRQSSRKDSDKPKFFKLKLNGLAGLRTVGHFLDLHVRLDDNALKIEESHDIGAIPVKRWNKSDRNSRFSPRGRGNYSGGGDKYRPRGGGNYQPRPSSPRPAESSAPKPKPKIQKNRSESS